MRRETEDFYIERICKRCFYFRKICFYDYGDSDTKIPCEALNAVMNLEDAYKEFLRRKI